MVVCWANFRSKASKPERKFGQMEYIVEGGWPRHPLERFLNPNDGKVNVIMTLDYASSLKLSSCLIRRNGKVNVIRH